MIPRNSSLSVCSLYLKLCSALSGPWLVSSTRLDTRLFVSYTYFLAQVNACGYQAWMFSFPFKRWVILWQYILDLVVPLLNWFILNMFTIDYVHHITCNWLSVLHHTQEKFTTPIFLPPRPLGGRFPGIKCLS